MPAGLGDGGDGLGPKLPGEGGEFGIAERLEIGRPGDAVEGGGDGSGHGARSR